MVQDRLVTLDRLVLLPAVGLGDFVEGYALRTSRQRIELMCTMPLPKILTHVDPTTRPEQEPAHQ